MDKFNSWEVLEDNKGSSGLARPTATHWEGQLGMFREGIHDERGNCSQEHSPGRNMGNYDKKSTVKAEGGLKEGI